MTLESPKYINFSNYGLEAILCLQINLRISEEQNNKSELILLSMWNEPQINIEIRSSEYISLLLLASLKLEATEYIYKWIDIEKCLGYSYLHFIVGLIKRIFRGTSKKSDQRSWA